jgi:hypothetical protein
MSKSAEAINTALPSGVARDTASAPITPLARAVLDQHHLPLRPADLFAQQAGD